MTGDENLPEYLRPERSAYLLKADSSQLDTWRAAAASEGSTLAVFARSALDRAATPPEPSTMMTVSRDCYRGDHKACHAHGCECNCH